MMMNNNIPQRGMNTGQSYYTTSLAPTNNIIWVQGIEAAKAWQLNPNSRAILLDSETEGKMYIKVCDDIGICSLRVFNYTEEMQSNNSVANQIDLSQYVTKDELANMIKEILHEQTVSATKSNDDSTIASTTAITNSGF